MELLNTTFLENTLRTWAIAFGTAAASYVGLRLLIRIVIGRVAKLAERTQTKWDDVMIAALRKTKALFLIILAASIGSNALELPARIRAILTSLTVIAFLVQGGMWLNSAIGQWLQNYRLERQQQDAASVMTMNALGIVTRIALWSLVLLLALDNLGVDITALVAGLGIGGVAVALALQNVLGDLFASLSIVLDKPFVLGDFLVMGEYVGNVENIGLKTTRIRSLSGEQLVFSNNDLLSSRIRNYGRLLERRILFSLGITYQTPRDQLERIPGMIRNAVEAQQRVRFDRSHFKAYGDSALIFETVYYVLGPEYNLYMDVQQAINLSIHEQFEREGIDFAYPTQTLFLVKADEGS